MQASSNSRYPRASHDSYHVEVEEHRTPPSVRRTANKRQSMPTIVQSDVSPDRSTAAQGMFRAGNERLYEAYNDLHSLAQDFEKPFDAPAILVVGHQTDGKSGESGRMHLKTFCNQSCRCTCLVCRSWCNSVFLQLWWKLLWGSSSTMLVEVQRPDDPLHCT